MVAGILGGSGTHVVQITVGIMVAAALIGYFLMRVRGSRRRWRPRRFSGCQPT